MRAAFPPSPFHCNLLYLKFNGRAVEIDYCSKRANDCLLHLDTTICSIKLAVTVFIVSLIGARLLPTTPTALCLWVAYMSLLWLQHTAFSLAPEACCSHREAIMVAFKLLYGGVLLALVPAFVLEPVQGLGTFLKVLVMGSGLVLLNCTGVLMPIPWRMHMVTNALAAAITAAATTPALVDTLLCTPQGAAYTHAAAAAMDALSVEVGALLLLLPGTSPPVEPRQEAAALVLALQLCWGLVAPSLYLYISELKCRQSYLRRHTRGSAAGLLLSPLLEGPSPLPLAILGSSVMLLVAACSWNLARLAAPPLLPWLEAGSLAGGVRALAAAHGASSCIAASGAAVS